MGLAEPKPFQPRAAPRRLELFLNEAKRTAGIPLEIVRDFRNFVEETEDLRDDLETRMNAVTKMLGMGMSADDTPLYGRLGPHRRFE